MRKDAEQPSTSGIIDTDTGGKKRARCQLCVSSDNKTSSQYDRKTNCASLMGQFDPEDNGRITGGLSGEKVSVLSYICHNSGGQLLKKRQSEMWLTARLFRPRLSCTV
ncbi:conserved hypothetical protein [Trichinella spiralis]|nr:conserved hypothetical protein [Trichinella spiralis]